jgi:VanZ family protein
MERKGFADLRWILTGAYLILLTALLVTPDPLALITLGERLPRPDWASTINDKIEHSGTFTVLTALAIWAMRGRRMTACFVAVALYGAATEIIQAFVPGRTADVRDWLADVAGAAAGVVLMSLLYRRSAVVRRT